MTPEQLALLRGVTLLLEQMGSWHFGTIILLVFLSPWIFLWAYGAQQTKRDKDRDEQFKAVVQMYENNVKLLEVSLKREQQLEKHTEDMSGIVHLNTQTSTRLIEKIDNNMYCPLVREKGPQS